MARQRTVFPTDEVAHVWAKQTQESGRNQQCNFYFEGSRIYSYGRHFCIADIIKRPNKFGLGGVALLTKRSYSSTTSGHISHVFRAISHMRIVRCYYPEDGYAKNIDRFGDDMESLISKINDTKKRKATRAHETLNLVRLIDEMRVYTKAVGGKISNASTEFKRTYDKAKRLTSKINVAVAQSEIALDREAKEEKRKVLLAKETENQARRRRIHELYCSQPDLVVNMWRNREKFEGVMDVSFYDLGKVDRHYLRSSSDGKMIETSIGASVKKESGKVLLDRILKGESVRGHDIDGYTVTGMNGVLTVGCHTIERSEIETFAKLEGWL